MKTLFLLFASFCVVGLTILMFAGKGSDISLLNGGLISIGVWAILDKLDEIHEKLK